MAGELTWLVRICSRKNCVPSTYSILGVIRKTLPGERFLPSLAFITVLSSFSHFQTIFFLACKLAIISTGNSNSLFKVIHYVGKFSMAEVFALALIIVVVKSFPGGSSAQLEWGAYIFTCSVTCSMIVSIRFEKKDRIKHYNYTDLL